jgi:hypothetical protein
LEHLGSTPVPSQEFTSGKSYFDKWRKERPVEEDEEDMESSIPGIGAPVAREQGTETEQDGLGFLSSVLKAPATTR